MLQEKLPYNVVEFATHLFAGTTGFSHKDMDQFFAYELNKQPREWTADFTGCSNRGDRFKVCLSMFPVSQQKALLRKLCMETGWSFWHGAPSKEDKDKLLGFLGGETAIDTIVGDRLEAFNHDYVMQVWKKALDRRNADPSGAITTARELLEAVCKHILDDHQVTYPADCDLPKLYKLTADCLNLSPEQHDEQIFKQILGGCQTVVHGMSSLRNVLGDAHGKGQVVYRPAPRHAELAVNLAASIALFLTETWEHQKG
ncbi:MAG: abortive infection family protein [Anaerolineae bacterium]